MYDEEAIVNKNLLHLPMQFISNHLLTLTTNTMPIIGTIKIPPQDLQNEP